MTDSRAQNTGLAFKSWTDGRGREVRGRGGEGAIRGVNQGTIERRPRVAWQCARASCSRIWSRASTSTRSQRLQRPTEFARAASGRGGTAISSRADCGERRGSSVTRPVRLHAPHSGQIPEFASVSQRVSRPLVRAVVLVLRGRSRLATFAAADIESRSPQVIRRRHYRVPRIVREVPDPFP
jgi:hypothetical protein